LHLHVDRTPPGRDAAAPCRGPKSVPCRSVTSPGRDRFRKTGRGVTTNVCYTPRWLAQAPQDTWRQPPRDVRRFGDFMDRITRRYKGKVRSWELWSEAGR